MRFFLGVDGGTSKTHAALVDETGALVGFGKGGGANHQSVGAKAALHEIDHAVRMAFREAQVKTGQVEVGYFCLAGADMPEDYAMLAAELEKLGLTRRAVVRNDTMAGLRSGLSRPWGVVVVCGTGFNAAGRGRDGRELRLPALGSYTGDWAGGGEIGVRMVGAVMRAWDGRNPPTLLTKIVLERLGFANEEEMLAAFYHERTPRAEVVALVPLLFEAAEAGDEVAREMVKQIGTEVGLTAQAFLRRLDLLDTDAEVVLSGSVFKGKGPLLLQTVTGMVRAVAPQARIVRPRMEPVGGAALLALEEAGLEVMPEMGERLAQGPLAMPAV